MDDDAMQQTLDIGDFEIERRLEAFARARLNPDRQVAARTRARVMREARLQFEAARIATHMAPAVALATRRSTARRVATPLLAASLWAGIVVGSVAAAQAGGPLYPTRIWLENATLPSGPADRAAAELARLDTRLGDALSAAARADADAVAAALDAYRQIADETIASTAGNRDLEAIVAAALDRHVVVLTAVADSLAAKGNTTAEAAVETAIERAIEHNAAVVAGLATNGGGKPADGGQPTGPGANNGSGGSGGGATGSGQTGGNTGNGQAGSAGDGGAKPSKEPKPTATPEPAPPTPEATPVHTPHHPNQ